MRHVLCWTAAAMLASLGACAGNDPPDDEAVNCATVTDDDEFVVGLERRGDAGALDFRFVSGDPAPPARNDNTWVIQVTSAGGAPATGASVIVTPFMPAHQHGAGKVVRVEAMPDAGQYELTPVNLWMPGVWEVTIDVTSAAGNDRVLFKFCIPA